MSQLMMTRKSKLIGFKALRASSWISPLRPNLRSAPERSCGIPNRSISMALMFNDKVTTGSTGLSGYVCKGEIGDGVEMNCNM